MALKMNSIKCPDCGAALDIEDGRKQCFCSYCGAKIVITNENEYTFHHIDDAKVKQAETERILELKKLEMEQQRRKDIERRKRLKILKPVIIIIAVLVFVFLLATNQAIFENVFYLFFLAVLGLIAFSVFHSDGDD